MRGGLHIRSRVEGAHTFLDPQHHSFAHLKLILHRIKQEGKRIDTATCASLLRWCGKEKALSHGRQLHAHMTTVGQDRNPYLANLLVEMYGKCGIVEDARLVFDEMQCQNVFSWTFMLAVYAQNGHFAETLQLFNYMQRHGIQPNKFTFFPIISACANIPDLVVGRRIHQSVIANGLELDLSLKNALLNMYGKCGSPQDAWSLFNKMHQRDVISWNAMISAYAQSEKSMEAFELFKQMDLEGIQPDRVTFLSILSSSASSDNQRMVHDRIISTGLESDLAVRTALVSMYGKSNRLNDARLIFDDTCERDVILWNAMIAAYAQNGQGESALELLRQMDLQGVIPNKVTFVSILDACANSALLETGKNIHKQIVTYGLESDVRVRNALVNMYGKCGSFNDAQAAFDGIVKRDVISWTSLITAYKQSGLCKEALALFSQMIIEGVKPNNITFISILDACANLSLESGRLIHQHIIASEFYSDISVRNALVNMYGKCGSIKDAESLFFAMYERNEITWNTMIGAYAQNGKNEEAFSLFCQMTIENIKPNRITFLSVLDACSNMASLGNGRMVYECIIASGYKCDITVKTALVNMYGKCGSPRDARSIFDSMDERDLISWNAMLAAYAENRQGEEAFALFKLMDMAGVKPDKITFISVLNAFATVASLHNGRLIHEFAVISGFEFDVSVRNALMNMYGRCGSLRDAQALFNEMHERDTMSWNAMIAAYAHNGQGMEAIELFQQMNMTEGLKADRITFINILNACSHVGLLDESRQFFVSISGDNGVAPLMEHYVCMIDLLGRAGFLDEAEDLVNTMPIQPNVVAWNTLLGACRMYGDLKRAAFVAEYVSQLDQENAVPFVMLSNIYAAAGRWDDAISVRVNIGNSAG